MSVYFGSRYADAYVVEQYSPSRGVVATSVRRRFPSTVKRISRSEYWDQTTRWDLIAQETLGSFMDYWKILDSNSNLTDPFSVDPGVAVGIPDGA